MRASSVVVMLGVPASIATTTGGSTPRSPIPRPCRVRSAAIAAPISLITPLVIHGLRRGAPLPDLHALVGREVERVARPGLVGVVPGVEVAHDRRAELRRAVRVGDQPVRELLVAVEAAPDLRPAEEEPLVAAEAVDHGRRLAAQRDLVCLVRDGEAGEVGDVLAQGELALDAL